MNDIYYKNIFLYSSFQYTGNIEEYFSKHSEKLVAFVMSPRLKNKPSLIRVYKKGKIISEEKVLLSENIFFYYFLWYKTQIYILQKYFSRKEKIILITFHPLTFFAMSLQRLYRKILFVYWVADYFPPVSTTLRVFEALKRFYNKKAQYACYLSDLINEKMNGKILNTKNRKTVMWSIIPKKIKRTVLSKNFSMLFVGVIKKGQGLEYIFDFLKTKKDYSIKIVGNCNDVLYKDFQQIIRKNKIEKQVFFPNKFFSDQELEKLSKTCQVGIALYDTGKTGATYYTDPGKVKTYAQYGLPIIMSNIPTVAQYIKKFSCGEIIDDKGKDLDKALTKMKKNYKKYIHGLREFNSYFYADTYFKKSFTFLEHI